MLDLAREFTIIGCTGFGGYLGLLLHRRIVDKHGWLDEQQFADAAAAAAIAPGGTSTALIVEIGRRVRGPRGAAVAMTCAVVPGALFVISLVTLFMGHQDDRVVRGLLLGASAGGVAVLTAFIINLWKLLGSSWIDLAGGVVVLAAAIAAPPPIVLAVSIAVCYGIVTVHDRRRGIQRHLDIADPADPAGPSDAGGTR